MPKVNRALISVSDKTDIVWLARELASMGVEIVSTGGTYKLLSQEGIKAVTVAEVTGVPEMLDGRVKTLHHKIHGGILADRSKPEHLRQLEYQKIPAIDMVVVNLYPFAETVSREGVTREEAIEQIDIGGPAMLRAAAKNHDHIAVVVNPSRYRAVAEEMKQGDGEVGRATRQELAAEAFTHTALYDTMISAYLTGESEKVSLPDTLPMFFRKVESLRYGENPHQAAALYAEPAAGPDSLAAAPQLSGSQLSFNNIMDSESAWRCVTEFDEPACVLIKHNNPCGVAVANDLVSAYRKAYFCDRVSAFGSVIALNRRVDLATADVMMDLFIEVLIAPGYDEDALKLLKTRRDMRILELSGQPGGGSGGMDFRRIRGGLLVQDYDADPHDTAGMKVVTVMKPTEEMWNDLIFAWKVCKHVRSNAVIMAGGGATLGIGAGQMSRVDSAMIAVEKAGSDYAPGSVVASDAFFPFSDAVQVVAQAGAVAIIQPGGSKNDEEVIAMCDKYEIAMVFTGRRHFLH